jgi:hypothetical protein
MGNLKVFGNKIEDQAASTYGVLEMPRCGRGPVIYESAG